MQSRDLWNLEPWDRAGALVGRIEAVICTVAGLAILAVVLGGPMTDQAKARRATLAALAALFVFDAPGVMPRGR